jgi:PTS system nitrogen regulatory IIA component
LRIDPALLTDNTAVLTTRLDAALEAGGVVNGVRGEDREAVLRAIIAALPVPAGCDRDFLIDILLARENAGSTSIGGGLAVPHPRYPIVLPVERPSITVCYLEKPIPYGAADGEPVHTLLVMLCPTVRHHLHLLARLSAALQEPAFAAALRRKAPAAEIIAQARHLEEDFSAPRGIPRLRKGT